MNRTKRFMGMLALMSLGFVNAASAHSLRGAPAFPIHHVAHFILPTSHAGGLAFNKSLASVLTKGGLVNERQSLLLSFGSGPGSLATKSFNQFYRTIVANGVKVGVPQVSPFTGGSVTGGTIQGDLYVQIMSTTPGSYVNVGEFTGTVGTNIPANFNTLGATAFGDNTLTPSFQNSLNFTAQSAILPPINSHSGGVGTGGVFSLGNSGSQRAFANLINGLTGRSVSLGRQIGLSSLSTPFAGGPVTGGLFVGTAYRNTLGSATYTVSDFGLAPIDNSPLYIFAFGNNPFNNPAGIHGLFNIPSQAGYVLFGNGLNKTITNGQILFPMVGPPIPGRINGSVFTIGSNPANNGTFGSVLNNLSSFLFF